MSITRFSFRAWLPAVLFAGVVLAINGHWFRVPLIESADLAANSIQVYHAKMFRELLGNYSRWQFHHPGPVFFYLLAAGEVCVPRLAADCSGAVECATGHAGFGEHGAVVRLDRNLRAAFCGDAVSSAGGWRGGAADLERESCAAGRGAGFVVDAARGAVRVFVLRRGLRVGGCGKGRGSAAAGAGCDDDGPSARGAVAVCGGDVAGCLRGSGGGGTARTPANTRGRSG